MVPRKSFSSVLCLGLLAPLGAFAAAVTPGDLLIYRVGDGSVALSTTAAPVFIDEYTTSGAFVQSVALPSTSGSAFTAVGNGTTEGIISRSQDGSTLIFTGYQKAAGGTSPAADSYTATRREVGTLTIAGTFSLATTITSDGGSTAATTIRSAISVD